MKDEIEEFFLLFFRPDVSKILADIFDFGAIVAILGFLIKKCYSFYLKRKNNLDLEPYFSHSVLQSARNKFIRSKCQNIDPANELEYHSHFAFTVRQDLLKFFLQNVFKIENPEQKFYLILGDAGMGKTTFLLNLFRLYNNNVWNIIASNKKIKLLPLGENYETLQKTIEQIAEPKNTILLLDALDESNIFYHEKSDDHSISFDKLIITVSHFKQVIITCRTNFFINEKEEPFELKIKKFNTAGNGYHIIKKLYLSPFNPGDVNRYLRKTFQFWQFAEMEKAKRIINSTKDIFFRPMLLSYIEDLVKLNKDKFLKFEVYETLIEAWINRESNKYPETERLTFKKNLYHFTYELAFHIYGNYKEKGYYISFTDAQKLAVKNEINLNELEIRSRTLLNRNSNGDYKFAHKTILECILAYFSFLSRRSDLNNAYEISYDLENFDFAKDLVQELHLNHKHSFKFPNFYDDYGISTDHIEKVLKERYKHSRLILVWQSGTRYRVHGQDIS